ncbi:hypothetical protein [Burkholderia glumae]
MTTIIERLTDIRDLVADDVHADSFQSIREYRARLVMVIDRTIAEARVAAPAEAVDRYQAVCAAAYQLAGVVGAPLRFLDALSDAANGEPMSADEALNLLPVGLNEIDEVNRSASAPAEAREPVATFDDGLKVYLDSWTGGRHEAGSFGEVTLRFTDECQTTVREYRAKDIVPADAGEAALTAAASDVLAERARQMEKEGYSFEHDDSHEDGEMALAAGCYASNAGGVVWGRPVPSSFPWSPYWWKPTTPRRDCVKAAALLIAEIERIDRAEARTAGAQGGKEGEA